MQCATGGSLEKDVIRRWNNFKCLLLQYYLKHFSSESIFGLSLSDNPDLALLGSFLSSLVDLLTSLLKVLFKKITLYKQHPERWLRWTR